MDRYVVVFKGVEKSRFSKHSTANYVGMLKLQQQLACRFPFTPQEEDTAGLGSCSFTDNCQAKPPCHQSETPSSPPH